MALRLRNSFHSGRPRGMAEHASVIAMLAWKLAIRNRSRACARPITTSRSAAAGSISSVEYLIFLALAADRIAHDDLERRNSAWNSPRAGEALAEMVEDSTRGSCCPICRRARPGAISSNCTTGAATNMPISASTRAGAGFRLSPLLRRLRQGNPAGEGQPLGRRPGHGNRVARGDQACCRKRSPACSIPSP
jgi:hypothetical protein